MRNETRVGILKSTLLASVGLFFFGFGVYLTIFADIGVGPWDAFNLGLSQTFGILYGNAAIAVSLVLLVIDVLLKEKIGIGMFLDAVISGKTVDLFNLLDLFPKPEALGWRIAVMVLGMAIMGFSQYFYMQAGLGCGPRDSLLIGLSRRIRKIPIGFIGVILLACVTAVGYFLGGPIGIGTLLAASLEGPLMQLAFRIMRFEPTSVTHQTFMQSFHVIFQSKSQQ